MGQWISRGVISFYDFITERRTERGGTQQKRVVSVDASDKAVWYGPLPYTVSVSLFTSISVKQKERNKENEHRVTFDFLKKKKGLANKNGIVILLQRCCDWKRRPTLRRGEWVAHAPPPQAGNHPPRMAGISTPWAGNSSDTLGFDSSYVCLWFPFTHIYSIPSKNKIKNNKFYLMLNIFLLISFYNIIYFV